MICQLVQSLLIILWNQTTVLYLSLFLVHPLVLLKSLSPIGNGNLLMYHLCKLIYRTHSRISHIRISTLPSGLTIQLKRISSTTMRRRSHESLQWELINHGTLQNYPKTNCNYKNKGINTTLFSILPRRIISKIRLKTPNHRKIL